MDRTPIVLYAEDDPDDRELLRETIKDRNVSCELIETANGREALLYLRSSKGKKTPPCLIILDLNMPVLNGRETLAIIKSELDTRTIPVVVFTTSSSPQDEEYCKRLSAEMVTKPSSLEELKKVVDMISLHCTSK